MKQSLAFVVLWSLIIVPTVSAQDSSVSATTRVELREDIKKTPEENRTLIASREAEFKANLQRIKDTRKQTIVTNIDARIVNRNTLWVSHWNIVLKRLTALIEKIQTRATEAATAGKDITGVTTAIASAKTAITSAQGAVDAQSGKTYTIDITTEDTLGQSVRATIATFHTDVKNVISLLTAARKAVETAFVALKTVVTT